MHFPLLTILGPGASQAHTIIPLLFRFLLHTYPHIAVVSLDLQFASCIIAFERISSTSRHFSYFIATDMDTIHHNIIIDRLTIAKSPYNNHAW